MVADSSGCAEHRLGTTALQHNVIFRSLSHLGQKTTVTLSEYSAILHLLRNGGREGEREREREREREKRKKDEMKNFHLRISLQKNT